ncbi:hypothetical protein C4578_00915 [Candidatus Microgenomates bacterium]|jgi:hypothetical protein|nr:MAG: hypothetical protein C4578_00915 [Candidatus Microgenomates bacterium]
MNASREFVYEIWNTTKESNWESLESNLRQKWYQSRGTEKNLVEKLLSFSRKMYYSGEVFPRYFENFFQLIREKA